MTGVCVEKFNLMGSGARSDTTPFCLDSFISNYTENSGNVLFYYACSKILNLHDIKYGWGEDSGFVNENSSGVVITMANQIGDHFDLLSSGPRISNIDKKIIAIGLGSQLDYSEEEFLKIPAGSLKWLEVLSKKSSEKNIAVRGRNTYNFLVKAGLGSSAVITGCPSLLINPDPKLGNRIKSKYNKLKNDDNLFDTLSVAAGDPHHKNLNLSILERNLISLVDRYCGSYLVQNPKILFKMTSGWYGDIEEKEYELLRKRWFPGFSNKKIRGWFGKRAQTYFSVPSWLYYLGNRSIVVGTRIHGVQAAMQSGTPAICIYIDARTKELCQTMKIPCISADKIYDKFNEEMCVDILDGWDSDEYDSNRMKLYDRFKQFFESNNIDHKLNF